MRKPNITTWILLPVVLSLLVSAFVGLQLFQDGSSYLLEMLITHSAVRHGRLSILLFQQPTILLIKALHRLEFDPLVTLPIVRLIFNLNYAIMPFVALFLSWMVVRKKREELFLWAALIILFVNLVNFSWVSELLVTVQLACPLLLALLQNPRGKPFWALLIFLTPLLFFLHPLVTTIYLVLAAVAAYLAYREPAYRIAAIVSTTLFLVLAITRGIYSFFTLSLYEVSFAESGQISDYFVVSRWENMLFLGTAVEIAVLVLCSQLIASSARRSVRAMPWFVGLQSFFFVLFATKFVFRDNLVPLYAIGCLGIPAFIRFWRFQTDTPIENTRRLYLACAFLAAASSSLLMAQYASAERMFLLKMGLDLFAALFIMCVAAIDSVRKLMPDEHFWRFRLVLALSTIFVCVMIAKSIMWQTSVEKLEQTLRQTEATCTELTSANYGWLEKTPYTMINNWAISSLALVIQDQQPRKLLLAQDDCGVFYQSGMVQIDPWSRLSQKYIVPPLE
jgi:hypothetical protein